MSALRHDCGAVLALCDPDSPLDGRGRRWVRFPWGVVLTDQQRRLYGWSDYARKRLARGATPGQRRPWRAPDGRQMRLGPSVGIGPERPVRRICAGCPQIVTMRLAADGSIVLESDVLTK